MRLNDKVKIIARGIPSYEHIKALSLLYRPIIDDGAYSCYITLYTLVDLQKGETCEYNLSFITVVLGKTLKKFIEIKNKLEAVGLFTTYKKTSKEYDEYIIRINPPELARGFKENDLFLTNLCAVVGKDKIEKLFETFHLKYFPLEDYKDVSKTFTDVYEYIDPMNIYLKNNFRGLSHAITPVANNGFDYLKFHDMLPANMQSKNSQFFSQDYENAIVNMAFIYSLNEEEMQEVYQMATTRNATLSPTKNDLSASAKIFYQNKNQKTLNPKIDTKENALKPELLENISPAELVSLFSENTHLKNHELSNCEAFYYQNKGVNKGVLAAVILSVYNKKQMIPNTVYLKKVLDTMITNYAVTTAEDAIKFLTDISDDKKTMSIKEGQTSANKKDLKKQLGLDWLDDVDDLLKKSDELSGE